MIIKLSHYRHGIPTIKAMLERNKHREPSTLIEDMTIATSMPVIVVAHFVGELTGFTDILNKKIKVLTDFYQYEKIEE